MTNQLRVYWSRMQRANKCILISVRSLHCMTVQVWEGEGATTIYLPYGTSIMHFGSACLTCRSSMSVIILTAFLPMKYQDDSWIDSFIPINSISICIICCSKFMQSNANIDDTQLKRKRNSIYMLTIDWIMVDQFDTNDEKTTHTVCLRINDAPLIRNKHTSASPYPCSSTQDHIC